MPKNNLAFFKFSADDHSVQTSLLRESNNVQPMYRSFDSSRAIQDNIVVEDLFSDDNHFDDVNEYDGSAEIIVLNGDDDNSIDFSRLSEEETTKHCSFSDIVKSSLMLLIAAPKGAASWYATFGPIAMIYQKNGLWLIGPVGAGALISISDECLKVLAKRFPDNCFLQSLADNSFRLNEGLGGLLADFGFAWGMLRTIAILIGGPEYGFNNYARIAAPIMAITPALIDRAIRYQDKQGHCIERSIMRHLARTIRGATSTVGFINQLILQGVISVQSKVPTTLIVLTAIAGGLSSLLQESHSRVSKLLLAGINLFCENPSLATAFFSFPNDIYAAVNDGSISEEFFYSNLAFSVMFLIALEGLSLTVAATSQSQPSVSTQSDESTENFSDEDESNDLLESLDNIIDDENQGVREINELSSDDESLEEESQWRLSMCSVL